MLHFGSHFRFSGQKLAEKREQSEEIVSKEEKKLKICCVYVDERTTLTVDGTCTLYNCNETKHWSEERNKKKNIFT